MKDIAIKAISSALIGLVTWYTTSWNADQNANQVANATRFMMEQVMQSGCK